MVNIQSYNLSDASICSFLGTLMPAHVHAYMLFFFIEIAWQHMGSFVCWMVEDVNEEQGIERHDCASKKFSEYSVLVSLTKTTPYDMITVSAHFLSYDLPVLTQTFDLSMT